MAAFVEAMKPRRKGKIWENDDDLLTSQPAVVKQEVVKSKKAGGDGVLLNKESDLPGAIAEGLKKGGLYLIDVRVSPTTASDPHGKLYYGIESKAPLLRPIA